MAPRSRGVRQAVVLPLRLYRAAVSPLLGARCRFDPSCSAYAIESVLRHGVVRGAGLALWRVLRCQPRTVGGYDPVPRAEG